VSTSQRLASVVVSLAVVVGAALAGRAADPRASSAQDSPEQVAQRECEAALQSYISLLRAQDTAALTLLFVPKGKVEHVGQAPVVGREQIAQFFKSFAEYKVLSQDMRVLRATGAQSHVSQSGTFVQVVRTPEGREVVARGWFLFQWERQAGGEWLLEYAKTSSSPLGEA
jgi:ketosteroid isomerase-like protein